MHQVLDNPQVLLMIAIGGLVVLYSFYQLLKKGLLFWTALLLGGVFAIQMGLKQPGMALEDMMDELKPSQFTKTSAENLQSICNGIESLVK